MKLVFEWDAEKAKANVRKHRVSLEEAKTIFNDPLLISFRDQEHSFTEERLISIGMSTSNRILLAVHTEREAIEGELVIRIISCRKATPSERRVYEKRED